MFVGLIGACPALYHAAIATATEAEVAACDAINRTVSLSQDVPSVSLDRQTLCMVLHSLLFLGALLAAASSCVRRFHVHCAVTRCLTLPTRVASGRRATHYQHDRSCPDGCLCWGDAEGACLRACVLACLRVCVTAPVSHLR
jgi:hypothetical protein